MISAQDKTIPLMQRNLSEGFACVNTQLSLLKNQTGLIQVGEFLSQATQLANQLPAGKHLINLCENRYLFTLSFCAAIIKGQTTLLPQNRAEETQRNLLNEYADTYLLHDSLSLLQESSAKEFLPTDIPQINLHQLTLRKDIATEIPMIDADFLAAIAFTSGSTGKPKANKKYWRTFAISTLMNGSAMLPKIDELIQVLATVPAQHMWGMETSVLMPFFWRVCVSDLRPLFPQDIAKSLTSLTAPRLLVTTPVHLRALVNSKISMPTCSRILCATAPLSSSLADEAEKVFAGDLLEVYGCSEIGSTAYRSTAKSESTYWTLIDGLQFTSEIESDIVTHKIVGDHLPDAQLLQDQLDIQGNQFQLLGRNEDMIDIGGKRGSLLEMNALLLTAPGVTDGVVFLLEADCNKNQIQRPAALVVAPETSRAEITTHFSKHLDPVFMPRPLVFVSELPREENGKLRRVRLLEFYKNLRSGI